MTDNGDHRWLPSSLRSQIALALAAVTLLIIAGLGITFDRTVRSSNFNEIEHPARR